MHYALAPEGHLSEKQDYLKHNLNGDLPQKTGPTQDYGAKHTSFGHHINFSASIKLTFVLSYFFWSATYTRKLVK